MSFLGFFGFGSSGLPLYSARMTARVVMIFGTFDGLHPGHRFFIEQAAKRGEVTVVVARDSTVERIKGRKPRQSQDKRIAAITQTFSSVRPILGDPSDFLAPVRSTRPDLIVLGYDQQLPPGVTIDDLPCVVERLSAFEPERYKSSLLP